ncbi:hypothetical protein EUGRSUZ_G00755 [Eucalyptus grandis]|uniref:Uncharacterized protein n=2 Tax=Eucalyptus grandis TaxID=71139 RepID=A0ACC3K186_EUCGR|nr:hypothetical protein EUGRSUZ_G00755 [Eucalyptus grandis]
MLAKQPNVEAIEEHQSPATNFPTPNFRAPSFQQPNNMGLSKEFTCNACGDDGDTSSYNCSIHQYDLYAECTDLVTRAKRKDHEHPHIVLFPDARIEPDLTCQESIAKGCWCYYCTDCDYGTRLDCVEDEAMEASVDNGGDETEDIGLMMMMYQFMHVTNSEIEEITI